jgi:ATP synthase protein I
VENPLGPENKRDLQAIGVAAGLGISIAVALGFWIGGGILLDRWLGTSPIFTFVGVALGLITAGYLLYELALLGTPDRGRVNRRLRRRSR